MFGKDQEPYVHPRILYERNQIFDPLHQQSEQEKTIYESSKQNAVNNKHKVLQQTDPILQTNVVQMEQKRQLKKQECSDRPSCVFDLESAQRKQSEQQWKPCVKKIDFKESQCSDINQRKQLKSVNQNQAPRNPITDGDQKSCYVKNPTVKKEYMPKNQHFF